ncbi:MAG: TIGR02300 family protein [Alphaproteobacteria bacterium]|nr:MAG: TIGR02300 family protein [Alphaproteobacteria bacterium]
MAKPEWGTKRICLSCGTRFYDLKKAKPSCPECGAVFDPEAQSKSRRRSAAVPAEEKVRAPKKAVTPFADDEAPIIPGLEGDEGNVEDVVIEDTDELGDDVDVEDVLDAEEEDIEEEDQSH